MATLVGSTPPSSHGKSDASADEKSSSLLEEQVKVSEVYSPKLTYRLANSPMSRPNSLRTIHSKGGVPFSPRMPRLRKAGSLLDSFREEEEVDDEEEGIVQKALNPSPPEIFLPIKKARIPRLFRLGLPPTHSQHVCFERQDILPLLFRGSHAVLFVSNSSRKSRIPWKSKSPKSKRTFECCIIRLASLQAASNDHGMPPPSPEPLFLECVAASRPLVRIPVDRLVKVEEGMASPSFEDSGAPRELALLSLSIRHAVSASAQDQDLEDQGEAAHEHVDLVMTTDFDLQLWLSALKVLVRHVKFLRKMIRAKTAALSLLSTNGLQDRSKNLSPRVNKKSSLSSPRSHASLSSTPRTRTPKFSGNSTPRAGFTGSGGSGHYAGHSAGSVSAAAPGLHSSSSSASPSPVNNSKTVHGGLLGDSKERKQVLVEAGSILSLDAPALRQDQSSSHLDLMALFNIAGIDKKFSQLPLPPSNLPCSSSSSVGCDGQHNEDLPCLSVPKPSAPTPLLKRSSGGYHLEQILQEEYPLKFGEIANVNALFALEKYQNLICYLDVGRKGFRMCKVCIDHELQEMQCADIRGDSPELEIFLGDILEIRYGQTTPFYGSCKIPRGLAPLCFTVYHSVEGSDFVQCLSCISPTVRSFELWTEGLNQLVGRTCHLRWEYRLGKQAAVARGFANPYKHKMVVLTIPAEDPRGITHLSGKFKKILEERRWPKIKRVLASLLLP